MGRFEGIVALVTGAGSGIGAATAPRRGRGASVVAADVNRAACEATAAAIRAAGGSCLARTCDVSQGCAVTELFGEVRTSLGVPEVVGIGGFAHTEDEDLQQWERVIAANLSGPFLVSRAALGLRRFAGRSSSTSRRLRAWWASPTAPPPKVVW